MSALAVEKTLQAAVRFLDRFTISDDHFRAHCDASSRLTRCRLKEHPASRVGSDFLERLLPSEPDVIISHQPAKSSESNPSHQRQQLPLLIPVGMYLTVTILVVPSTTRHMRRTIDVFGLIGHFDSRVFSHGLRSSRTVFFSSPRMNSTVVICFLSSLNISHERSAPE